MYLLVKEEDESHEVKIVKSSIFSFHQARHRYSVDLRFWCSATNINQESVTLLFELHFSSAHIILLSFRLLRFSTFQDRFTEDRERQWYQGICVSEPDLNKSLRSAVQFEAAGSSAGRGHRCLRLLLRMFDGVLMIFLNSVDWLSCGFLEWKAILMTARGCTLWAFHHS